MTTVFDEGTLLTDGTEQFINLTSSGVGAFVLQFDYSEAVSTDTIVVQAVVDVGGSLQRPMWKETLVSDGTADTEGFTFAPLLTIDSGAFYSVFQSVGSPFNIYWRVYQL